MLIPYTMQRSGLLWQTKKSALKQSIHRELPVSYTHLDVYKRQTLYGALNSLQEKGWIAPFGDSAGRKKEYLITTQGKEIAEKELIRLNELVGVANEIIGGAV